MSFAHTRFQVDYVPIVGWVTIIPVFSNSAKDFYLVFIWNNRFVASWQAN